MGHYKKACHPEAMNIPRVWVLVSQYDSSVKGPGLLGEVWQGKLQDESKIMFRYWKMDKSNSEQHRRKSQGESHGQSGTVWYLIIGKYLIHYLINEVSAITPRIK